MTNGAWGLKGEPQVGGIQLSSGLHDWDLL